MEIAQKKLEQRKCISISRDVQTTSKVTFFANSEVNDFLGHLGSFGKVTGDAIFNTRTIAYSIEDKQEMNIRLQSDASQCVVQGACLTDDGVLLLADYHNRKLKRANILKKSVVDHFVLPGQPHDVCCINKREAAASLSDNSIQFISLGNQMALIRQLKLNHLCYGIACKGDRLYVTEAGSSLYIHDMEGNLLQKVADDKLGKSLFKRNQHITFSDNGDRIFVADWHNGVITLDTDGCHIDTKGFDSELTNAHDLCSDRRGNLFVSGYGSHNIVQIAQDGETKLDAVVKQSYDILRPYCLCFDPRLNVLIVTSFQSDIVKLFYLR